MCLLSWLVYGAVDTHHGGTGSAVLPFYGYDGITVNTHTKRSEQNDGMNVKMTSVYCIDV